MANSPGERLKQLRESVGLDQKGFAAKIGVSPGVLGFVERGERKPSKKLMEKLYETMSVSSDWLLNGVGDMIVPTAEETAAAKAALAATREYWANQKIRDEDYAIIELHDAYLSAGNGTANLDERVVKELAFRTDWLRDMGLKPTNLKLARALGDSMIPMIFDGDLVMVDVSNKEIAVKPAQKAGNRLTDIYAIRLDGEARVKRLERPSTDTLIIYSENANEYPPEVYTGGEMNRVDVIGKVVWWSHAVRG